MFFCFRFNGVPPFTEGRCPGSKVVIFNQSNSFARTPIINLNGRSFTIAFWIKQTRWVQDEVAAIYSDWYDPWQFLISTNNQKITFNRRQYGSGGQSVWWSLESTKVTLDTWTHVVVTCKHMTGAAYIYADGKEIGYNSYTPEFTFYEPTGNLYQIGKDGYQRENHQFHGLVMDLYVFGTALSLDQIKKLRGAGLLNKY